MPEEMESFYAMRRTDGQEIHGEYTWVAAGPNDWEAAEADSEDYSEPIEYQLVRMHVEVIETRIYPRCHECDQPSTHWGLCEVHAREDDPEFFQVVEGGDDA